MGVLVKKHRGAPAFTGIAKLAIVGFIISIASSFVDTIWAVYMDSFLHSEVFVGLLSAGLTLVAFFSYFFFIPLIERTNKSKIFFYSLFLFGVTYLLFAINTKFYFFVVLAFILTILYTFRLTSYGIIIKDKSQESQLSRNEGLIYTFTNTAWVIGPLIAGYLANKYNFSVIFLLAGIFMIIATFLFKISKIRDANIKKKVDGNIIKNFKDFFKNRDRVIAYFLSGGVNLWWVLIYLFMPLHIIRNGLNDLWIGYFLFAVAIPLILTEYHFSKLAGKWGFRKIFRRGFLFVAILSIIAFFILNIYLLLGILVIASFGMAMVEPTTEAYFFDISKKKEDCRFYGPYNTGIDANHFIGKVSASVLLIFLPFKYLFLLFGFFMFIMYLLTFKVRNIVEKKKRRR